jgi:hypothetical protein
VCSCGEFGCVRGLGQTAHWLFRDGLSRRVIPIGAFARSGIWRWMQNVTRCLGRFHLVPTAVPFTASPFERRLANTYVSTARSVGFRRILYVIAIAVNLHVNLGLNADTLAWLERWIMTEVAPEEGLSRVRGGKESVVEAFGIRGLYGYRSISLSSEFAATILIARNGTGKTTLLGALDAFLRRQFIRLRDLEFEEIYCKIRGIDKILALTRQDISLFTDFVTNHELTKLSISTDIAPGRLFSFLCDEWPDLRRRKGSGSLITTENAILKSIVRSTDYSSRQARDILDKLSMD